MAFTAPLRQSKDRSRRVDGQDDGRQHIYLVRYALAWSMHSNRALSMGEKNMAEENARLKLPEPERRKKRGKGRVLALVFGLVLLGCAVTYGAWIYYSVQTPSAVLENNLLTLGTQVPSRVAEVMVKKNEHVLAGQTLIRFEASTHEIHSAEVRAQAASVQKMLPTSVSMEEVTRRIADAQGAEQNLASRIMQSRALEEDAARDVQRQAEEHAKAQLELRRLDLLSAQYSVPRAQHEQARNEESSARQKLEKARAMREEYSRMRATADEDLYRIRMELADLKTVYGQAHAMIGNAQKSMPASIQTPSASNPPDIIAPSDAVVTDVFVQSGTWVQPDQQLIAMVPDEGALEATAWFPEKDGAKIQPGQSCRVFILELPGKSFSGRVEQVLPVGSLPPKFPLAVPVQARQIPVRIRFAVDEAGTYAELKPGMRAAVRVHNFTLPWMRISAPTQQRGGKE